LLVAAVVGSATASYAVAASGEVTNLTAARIPTANHFDGFRSIKHAPLTNALYATMKEETGKPQLLAVACWSPTDWPSVSGDDAPSKSGVMVMGFWKGDQPRWLHLSFTACDEIQQVIDGEPLTGARASGLVVAAHETLHAYGVHNEAQTNCYAVQITPVFAKKLGVDPSKIGHLTKLARNYTRLTAPSGYWNAYNCRDGGRWDLEPGINNLT
jgi:hypothetical protein